MQKAYETMTLCATYKLWSKKSEMRTEKWEPEFLQMADF